MRLTGAVVADDHETPVVGRILELKLRDDEVTQLLGHAVRDHKGLDKTLGFLLGIGLSKLDDRLDGVKLNEVGVFHRCLQTMAYSLEDS